MFRAGFDIFPIHRVKRWIGSYDAGVLASVFTANELAMQAADLDRLLLLAICFAAKEAMIKALALQDGLSQLPRIESQINGRLLRSHYGHCHAHGSWQITPHGHIAVALLAHSRGDDVENLDCAGSPGK